MAIKKKTEQAEAVFTGEQLIRSARFADLRDVACAVLDKDKKYSIAEADAAMQTYLKGKVY